MKAWKGSTSPWKLPKQMELPGPGAPRLPSPGEERMAHHSVGRASWLPCAHTSLCNRVSYNSLQWSFHDQGAVTPLYDTTPLPSSSGELSCQLWRTVPSHLLSVATLKSEQERRREQPCLRQLTQEVADTGPVTSHAEVSLDMCAVSKL